MVKRFMKHRKEDLLQENVGACLPYESPILPSSRHPLKPTTSVGLKPAEGRVLAVESEVEAARERPGFVEYLRCEVSIVSMLM